MGYNLYYIGLTGGGDVGTALTRTSWLLRTSSILISTLGIYNRISGIYWNIRNNRIITTYYVLIV